MIKRLLGAFATAAVIGAASSGLSIAADYPTQPIKVIVGYAPGGSVDIVTRIIAEKLSQDLGQQVVVENKPGGGTVIASGMMAKAAPDGYTLMNADIAHGANPALQAKLPYDTKNDFVPISLLAKFPAVLVVNNSVKADDVKSLVALAKAEPTALNYSSSGIGSLNFLATELFKKQNGVQIAHIPYKSGGEAVTAILGGFAQVLITTAPPLLPHAEKLKVLAVSSPKRLPSLPNVPTFAEAGFAQFDVQLWQGFFAPKGTDPAIVAKLNKALLKVMAMPDVQAKIKDLGGETVASSPEEFAKFVDQEVTKWSGVVTPEMRAN